MKKYILILSIVFCSFKCFSPIRETDEGQQKKIADLSAGNLILSTRVDSLSHLSDSLRLNWQECQQDNKQLHFWIDSTKK